MQDMGENFIFFIFNKWQKDKNNTNNNPMIIKKIFYPLWNCIFQCNRKITKWCNQIRHKSQNEIELNTFDEQPRTYYVLATDEEDPPRPRYPLSNSYIQENFPSLSTPFLRGLSTAAHGTAATTVATTEATATAATTVTNNQIEFEYAGSDIDEETGNDDLVPDMNTYNQTQTIEDRKIYAILDELRRQNEELLKYLPKETQMHISHTRQNT